MNETSLKLQRNLSALEETINKMSEHLSLIPAEITLVPVAEQADLVLVLHSLRDLMREGVKEINKVREKAEEHLCKTIASDEEIPYRHPIATITPYARGYFSVTNAEDVINFLSKYEDNPVQKFTELVMSKRACNEYFEEFLQEGEPLPRGIRHHIIATVQIRRKKNG